MATTNHSTNHSTNNDKNLWVNWNITGLSRLEISDFHEDLLSWTNYEKIHVQFNDQEIELNLIKTSFGAEFHDIDHKILFEVITEKNQVIITNYFDYEVLINHLSFKK